MQAHVHGDARSAENSESNGDKHDGRRPEDDLRSTLTALTTVHSRHKHDGRRLSKRPADEGGVFNDRPL